MNIFKKISVTAFYVFLMAAQAGECLAMKPNVTKIEPTVYLPGRKDAVKISLPLNIDHMTKMSITLDQYNRVTLTGGHFVNNFTTFELNQTLYLTTVVDGKLKIGIIVPSNIMSRLIPSRRVMRGYGNYWIQVVWFNENKINGATKTLFGFDITLDEVIKALEIDGISDPQYAYVKDGRVQNSFYLPGFSTNIIIVFDKSACHTIYPLIGIKEDKKALLIKTIQKNIDDKEFLQIVETAKEALLKASLN